MKPCIVAHRGAPLYARENTLESFDKAIALGADTIEFDVRRTRDGVLVVFHDSSLAAPGCEPLPISSLEYRQLSTMCTERGFHVPTLGELFNATAGRTSLLMELKETGYEEEALDLMLRHFDPERCAVQSFLPPVVSKVKRSRAPVQTGLLAETAEQIADQTVVSMCDFLALEKKLFHSSRGLFEVLLDEGLSFAVWTVDRAEELKVALSDPMVKWVITNRCDLAVAINN